jgi:hypothetical protein
MLRGISIALTDALPGVNKRTIIDIPRINSGIRELEISGFKKIADTTFASALRQLTSLRVIILRYDYFWRWFCMHLVYSGCSMVGTQTATAIASSCPDLKVVNLNYTSANPFSVGQLVNSCKSLESLKVAGIQNWASKASGDMTPINQYI